MRELDALPALLDHTYRLANDLQNQRACRLLSQALAIFDPITAPHDPRLIRAAVQYIGILEFVDKTPDRSDTQLAWARYAQSAALTCYGAASPHTQSVTGLYAGVCSGQGLTFDAALTHERLLAAHLAYGPEELIPGAWEQLAMALHADGQCDRATTEIRDAFSYWKHTGVPRQPTGGELLRTYASILAGCGHTEAARTLLAEHAYLVALPGAPDRETAALVTAVQIATAEREHPSACTADPPPDPASMPRSSPAWRFWQAILLQRPPTTPTGAATTTSD